MVLPALLLTLDKSSFIDVISVKFAYGAGIEERIYIRFAKIHLCCQV